MNDITITFLVLAAVVVIFVWDRLPVALVALGTAITLWATGVLNLQQALAGFGDPTVLFIASLFIVAEALDASGVTAWAGQQLLKGAGESRTRVLVFMLLLVALVTALITVNASVAALMPVVVVMAIRLKWPPSQLLMPLAFGAHAGSLLSLTGTPVNVIISDAAADAGVGAVGFVEFAWAGVPLVIGTIAIVVLLGDRLLPKRNATAISRDFSDHAGTLTAQYGVSYATGTLMTRTAGVAEVVLPPR
jgi:Na+/H+ antiporter NhaD/arsenite permease-like protein